MLFLTFATLLALAGTASPAAAHASFDEATVVQGTATELTFQVPHGCGEEPTLRVRVRIPEGVVAVEPLVEDGWTVETRTGAYADGYVLDGGTVTEGVQEIIWSGELPSADIGVFSFRATVSESIAPGTVLAVPMVQECETGTQRWIEIPAAGEERYDLMRPAPSFTVAPRE